jgi:hypothetical protein
MSYWENHLSRLGRCVMTFGKWKKTFIKNDVMRFINTPRSDIKTFVAFMNGTIANKNTLLRSKREFGVVIGTQVWPTCGTQKCVVWNNLEVYGKSFLKEWYCGSHDSEAY